MCKADATNTTSLPIREKATDLTAKPTIPVGDAFNSATAANASTLGHTSAVTSDIENNSAGVAGTKNLSDTLSKTQLDMGAEHGKVPASKNEPGLAGFGGDRKIDPEDKSQLPTEVSNATTSGTLTSSTDEKSAGAAGTANLSETLAKTNPPTLSPTTTPKSPLTTGEEAGGKSDASKAGAAKEADRTSTKTRSRGESLRAMLEHADMVTGLVEEKNAHKNAAATNKETSPSGEKEKVSKMEKLKEKLHLKKHKSEE